MDLLPPGSYPFIDRTYELADMVFAEAPAELEAVLKAQAKENGVDIIRDAPVELKCRSEEWPDAVFVVFWPSSSDRINLLVPKQFALGRG